MIKLQFGCLTILLFIAAIYFSAKRVKTYSHKIFSATLFVAMVCIVFDMVTVYTVNHLELVPAFVNRLCHDLFLSSMLLEVFLCYLYVKTLIYPDALEKKERSKWMYVPIMVAIFGVFVLPLKYVDSPRSNYSWGLSVFMTYGVIYIYMLFAGASLIYHWKNTNRKKRSLVLLAYGIQLVISSCQAAFPDSLISCLGITLINLAFFLTVESPDVHLIERLWEEKERADEANAAKSSFLSNMSHEIRTPMNAIVGLTEVLLRKEWPPEETGYLMNIKSSGNALLSLINDLLDFSKIESGKFVISEDTYDIAQMLRDIQIIGKTRIGDRPIELKMEIDSELPVKLYGDSLRIRQVVINIMNNAIKFTELGAVTVGVKVVQKKEDKVKLLISVCDTGQGIRREDMQKLFDAFTQVDIKKNRGKEGTGLGLAISKQLVELMGGTLQVESEYGRGSEFFFELWQEMRGEELLGDFESRQSAPQKESEEDIFFEAPEAKILLVDDNDINREVAVAMLEPLQLQIEVASNGSEALEMVQRKHYDLVFMDRYMPVMDGIEATVAIRKLEDDYYRQLPIIALTADAVAGVKEQFIEVGMNDFVSKPIRMKEICEKLKEWLPKELIKA